jgi:hypothetical protein
VAGEEEEEEKDDDDARVNQTVATIRCVCAVN